ncbi:hypothetical protein ACMV5I_29560, partial [Serratia sp. T13T92]
TFPLGITFTRLRVVRREGVNEHGPVKMSGGEREIFFGLMKWPGKIYCERHGRPLDSKTGCACLSPGERTQMGEDIQVTTRAGTRRNAETRGRETALPQRGPAASPGW